MKLRWGRNAVAAVVLTVVAFLMSGNGVVYGKSCKARVGRDHREKTISSEDKEEGNGSRGPFSNKVLDKDKDNDREKPQENKEDRTFKNTNRKSFVWVVVVGLVLVTAGYARTNDHFYKKHKRKEEEKAKKKEQIA